MEPPSKEQERMIDQLIIRALESIQETYIGLNRDPKSIVDLLLVIQPHLRKLVKEAIDSEIAYMAVRRIEDRTELTASDLPLGKEMLHLEDDEDCLRIGQTSI